MSNQKRHCQKKSYATKRPTVCLTSHGENKKKTCLFELLFLNKKFRFYVRQEMKAKDNSRLISWFCISCPSRSMVVVALKVWLWIEPMTFSRNFHLLSPTFQSLLLGMHIILLVLQIMRNAGNSTVCSSTIYQISSLSICDGQCIFLLLSTLKVVNPMMCKLESSGRKFRLFQFSFSMHVCIHSFHSITFVRNLHLVAHLHWINIHNHILMNVYSWL